MILLPLIEYKQSIMKFRGLMKFEVRLTRGFAYCIASLPIVYILWDSIDFELIRFQILIYFLALLSGIFNFGISTK